MKKIFFIGSFFIGLLGLLVGGCGGVGAKTVGNFLHHKIKNDGLPFKMFLICVKPLPLLSKWEELTNDKTYLILLQNNTELRPSGGFMGSYARINMDKQGLKNVLVQDIYQPDGQIKGHVEPPYPIQEAFGQGWWKLRDANWSPDFPTGAKSIAWFFKEGGETKVDGLIAVNMNIIGQLLRVFDGVLVQTYETKITDVNLYSLAQKNAEYRLDTNKTLKQDFLGAVGTALIERIKNTTFQEKIKIGQVIADQLKNKQILVWFEQENLQKEIKLLGFDGGLKSDWRKGDDFLYVVDTNLGSNKANCCIEKYVSQKVDQNTNKVTIQWENNNEFSSPRPPIYWGGNYVNYVRVVVPNDYLLERIEIGGRALIDVNNAGLILPASLRSGLSTEKYADTEWEGVRVVGFWMVVPAGESDKAELTFTGKTNYSGILVKRQPGVQEFNYKLIKNNEIVADMKIKSDMRFGF